MTKPLPDTVVALNSKTCVNTSEITLLEAKINYTRIHFLEKSPLTLATTMKKIEPILRVFGFIRIHRKFMLNMIHIREILLAKDTVVLLNDIEVRVSRRKRNELIKILRQTDLLVA